MSIVVNPFSRPEQWMSALKALLPDERLHLWPDVGSASEVELVLAWSMPVDELTVFTNLQAIFSLGAGVDQWKVLSEHPTLADVDVVRLIDPAMADEMAAYALHWVLHFQRSFDQMQELQRQHRFEQPPYTPAEDYPIGILGHGTIGSRIGRAFAGLGYPVNSWNRTPPASEVDAAEGEPRRFVGTDELTTFLGASKAIINVLPNTADTAGLLSSELLAAFQPGALFVNIGRGTVVNEYDLAVALRNGQPGQAVLDVTAPEPPLSSSPLFDHPKVVLTGHTAGATLIPSASRVIAANIKRLRRGEQAYPLLDRARGY